MAIVSFKRVTGSPNIHPYLEQSGSADDFQPGDVVKTNASGYTEIATYDSIMGVVQGNATGVEGTSCYVDVINPGDIFSVPHKASSTTIKLLTTRMDISLGTGAQTVASGNSSMCFVVDRDTVDEWGKIGGRLLIRFDPDVLQGYRVGK